jgi:hypothetical protein
VSNSFPNFHPPSSPPNRRKNTRAGFDVSENRKFPYSTGNPTVISRWSYSWFSNYIDWAIPAVFSPPIANLSRSWKRRLKMTGVCILNCSAYEAAKHSRVVLLCLLPLFNKQVWGSRYQYIWIFLLLSWGFYSDVHVKSNMIFMNVIFNKYKAISGNLKASLFH